MGPRHTSIQELAYRLWVARGRPDGSAEEDWHEAEHRLQLDDPARPDAIDASLQGTFPASDAPASRLKDQPPSNADAKWRAAAEARQEPSTSAQRTKAQPASAQPASAQPASAQPASAQPAAAKRRRT